MYYLYLDKNGDFSSPKYLMVYYKNHYFKRSNSTSWDLDDEGVEELLSKHGEFVYSIEKKQFEKILLSWGESQHGYKFYNFNEEPDFEYGKEYED